MSHGDEVAALPAGWRRVAHTANCAFAAVEHETRPVPPHPVPPRGRALAVRQAGAAQLPLRRLRPARRLEHEELPARGRRGHPRAGRARPATSSAGSRAAWTRAWWRRSATAPWASGSPACIVNHGLLREGEAEEVARELGVARGLRLEIVDARRRFLDRLAGVTEPERKRKHHRRGVHPRLRGGGEADRPGRVPGAGHALPGRDRERLGRLRLAGDQEPPQRRRPARAHEPQAHRAAARAVQGRGARAGPRARAAGPPRGPAPVPGPGPGGAHPRARSPSPTSSGCAAPTPSSSRSCAARSGTAAPGRRSRCCCRSRRWG